MRAENGAGLLLACLMGATGCSEALPTRAVAPHPEAPALGAASVEAPDRMDDGCFPAGAPHVVATRVAPRAGIAAYADGSRVRLHFATTAAPRVALEVDPRSLDVVENDMPPGPTQPAPATRGPVEVRLRDGRGLFAWTDGSTYDGLHVMTQGFGARTNGFGSPVDVDSQGSAIGQPAAALTPDGQGVLAFIESNGAGFDLVVARLTCADRGA